MLRKTAATTLATSTSSTREFAATFQDHLAHTLEDVVATGDAMIAVIRSGYALWQVPVTLLVGCMRT